MKEIRGKLTNPWRIASSWIATLLIPVVLLFLGLHLLASENFLKVEYKRASFPPDSYGFSVEQRLEYANVCIQYLSTKADINLLSDLRFPDETPLFNERELDHMEDVKAVFQPMMNLGTGFTLALLGLLLLGLRSSWRWDLITGIRRGGWLIFGLVALAGVVAAISFDKFFEKFHAIFFEGDTWRFLYSDTLIRLFPMQFWQDAVLFLLLFTAGLGLLLGLFLKPKKKRSND